MIIEPDPFAAFIQDLHALSERHPHVAMVGVLVDTETQAATLIGSVPRKHVVSLLQRGLTIAELRSGARQKA